MPAPATTASDLRRVLWTLVAVDVAVGLLIDLVVAIVQPTPPGEVGTSLVRLFSYFTIESNIIVLASTLPLARDPRFDGARWRVLRVMALLGITITGLVYWIVLAPTSHPQGASVVANICLHYVSPLGTVGGWLLLGPRPRMSMRTAVLAMVWPVLWIGYTRAHGAASGWYPYNFINVTAHGYAAVGVNIAAIFVLGLVLLALFRLGDRLLPGGRDAEWRGTPARSPAGESRR